MGYVRTLIAGFIGLFLAGGAAQATEATTATALTAMPIHVRPFIRLVLRSSAMRDVQSRARATLPRPRQIP